MSLHVGELLAAYHDGELPDAPVTPGGKTSDRV